MKVAEQDGFERGRVAGERALSEQLVHQRAELQELQNGVLESMRNVLPGLIQECENDLISLAAAVASKLVAGFPISAELVETAVREALAKAESHTAYEVFVNPEDLELLRKSGSSVLADSEEAEDAVRFRGDDQVSRGGCRVHTRFGTIDGTRENKADRIMESLIST